MPRARSIKPSFFKNLELSQLGPDAMLLFAGMWTLADREGRLKDSSPWIKAEIFPYRPVKVDMLMSKLAAHGFIERYQVDGNKYIQIPKFLRHQSPHQKEAPSTIPAPGSHRNGTELKSLTPDSGLLTPDSGLREPDSQTSSEAGVPGQSRASAASPPRPSPKSKSPTPEPSKPAGPNVSANRDGAGAVPNAHTPLAVICDAIRKGISDPDPDVALAAVLMREMAQDGIHPDLAAFWVGWFCERKAKARDPVRGTKLLLKVWRKEYRQMASERADWGTEHKHQAAEFVQCPRCPQTIVRFNDGMVVDCECGGKGKPGLKRVGELKGDRN